MGGGPDLGVAHDATVWAKTMDDAVGVRRIPAALDPRFSGLNEILLAALLLGLALDAADVLRHHPADEVLVERVLQMQTRLAISRFCLMRRRF